MIGSKNIQRNIKNKMFYLLKTHLFQEKRYAAFSETAIHCTFFRQIDTAIN